MPAGVAETSLVIGRDHPVAHAGVVVLAEFVGPVRGGQSHGASARYRVQRGYLSQFREITKKPAAILTPDILEIEELAAALAAKQFHLGFLAIASGNARFLTTFRY